MSVRQHLITALSGTGQVPTLRDVAHAEQLVDAYRAEILAETKADFFQPDHTYQRGRWTFHCLAVAPITWGNGEARAVGYLTRNDGTGTATDLGPRDWAHGGWVDATRAGEPRG